MRRCLEGGSSGSTFSATDSSTTQVRHSQFKDAANGQKSSVATLFEQGTSCMSYALITQVFSILDSSQPQKRYSKIADSSKTAILKFLHRFYNLYRT